ncbi:MAG: hypothetical protein IPF50_12395 [Proteobacteria bacterium]|nr:hypothetical protein [Pseudomonadota bacterium]
MSSTKARRASRRLQPLTPPARTLPLGRSSRTGAANRSRLLTPASIYFMAVLAAIAFGINLPTSAYLSPQSGLGYALGIAGGSAMLLLLLYPVRKRMPNARYLGSTRAWFRLHMTLGIFGPALILFHSNFSLGATNSNVALVCMLIVSGSGLFGRYFYGHIHLCGDRAAAATAAGCSLGNRRKSSTAACGP